MRIADCGVERGMLTLVAAALAFQSQVADTSPFRALPLPAANRVRSASGAPGPDYWQQRADYVIRATLDTAGSVIRGSERIHYENHSPDTLAFVWVQIEQNIFARNSVTYALNQPPLHFAGGAVFDFTGRGFIGGITIERVRAVGKELPRTQYGTMMRAELPRPLAPRRTIDFDVAWHFPVPPYGGGRMGRIGTRLYEIGQWYPRMVVYDDVHGWNPLPYIGAGEFYLEYGDFDVTLTLPAGFVLAATGTVANPLVVWTPEQRARLATARRSSERVQIVTKAEATAHGAQRTPGTKTWHFTARNVRDFAWAASPDFRWDASAWNGVLIQTFYRPSATPWEEANRMAWFTIKHFSETWGTYPWPHATTVEGLVEGMEYPMLTFVPSIATREDQYWVLTHEFGHEWFPMMVGSDERRYPWMDEGFNTFIDYGSAEGYFQGAADGGTGRRDLPVPALRLALAGGAGQRRHDAAIPFEPWAEVAPSHARAVPEGRLERDARPADRDVEPGQPVHGARGDREVGGRRRGGPEGDLPGRRSREQPVAAIGAATRPLRIALLTSSRFWRGSSKVFAVLGRGLASRGHTTTAVVAYAPLVGGFQAHSLSVRKLPVGHTSLKGARALRQALGRGELAADMVLVDRARDIRLAAFASVGTPLVVVYCISTPRPPRDLLTRLAFRRVALTVFLTEQLAQRAFAEASFMRRAGHRVIPNGVDCDLFRPDEAAGRAFRRRNDLGDGPVLLGVGALEIEKRWGPLLDSVARLAPAAPPLVLCGTGALEGSLRAQAKRLGLDVRFVGQVDSAELIGAYNAATCVVHTRPDEVFAVALIEALACGRPVLAAGAAD